MFVNAQAGKPSIDARAIGAKTLKCNYLAKPRMLEPGKQTPNSKPGTLNPPAPNNQSPNYLTCIYPKPYSQP